MTTTSRIHPDAARVVPDWELCDRMRRSLRLVGLTNIEVAYFLGVKAATISTWLNGRRKPGKAVMMVWADMTGVDFDWLETGTPSGQEAGGRLYGIRDLNPEPADMRHGSLYLVWSVNVALSPNRRRGHLVPVGSTGVVAVAS